MVYPSLLVPDSIDPEELQKLTGFDSLESNPDFILVTPLEDKKSISIDQVHVLQSQIGLKPYSHDRQIICIRPADVLTLPAQQALLKTLEEPPAQTQILLLTDYPSVLLETIRSRTQEYRPATRQRSPEERTYDFSTLFSKPLTISKATELASEWGTDKETAILRLRELALFLHDLMKKDPKIVYVRFQEQVLHTLKLISSNVHVKLALEELLYNLRNLQKDMV